MNKILIVLLLEILVINSSFGISKPTGLSLREGDNPVEIPVPPVTNGIPLLVLIASDMYNHLMSKGLFQSWTNQVNRERNFYLRYKVLDPVMPIMASNRLEKVKEIYDFIEAQTPSIKAVQIFGGLAIPTTGSDVADGHRGCQAGGSANGRFWPQSGRLTWVDWPYTGQIAWTNFTDKFRFETNNIFCFYGNQPGDKNWDQAGLPPYTRPVWFLTSSNTWDFVRTNTLPNGMGITKRIIARVDFHEMGYDSNTNTAAKVPTNFWSAGKLIWPRRDEMLDYENYFKWDLTYRKNQWNPTPDAWIYSSLWNSFPNGPEHVTNIVRNRLNIIRNPNWGSIAGYQPYMVWNTIEPMYWYYWERPSDGAPLKTVWLNTFKSSVYEYNVRHSMRRYLATGSALIATWSYGGRLWNPIYQGNDHWTVYDALKYSMGPRPFGTTENISGDLTLPLRIPSR
jgi:hypothetical protein